MRVWRVAMNGLHGSKVLVTHMKHLCTFPWSQMSWTVLQGGRLLILVPVLLQIHKIQTQMSSVCSSCFKTGDSSTAENVSGKLLSNVTVSLINY